MFPFTKLRVVDHRKHCLSFSPLESFAYDDTFSKSVGHTESIPIIRAWVHRPTVVLGIQDSRLPYLEEGIELLHKLQYDVIMRNSGGLAVLLDEGILNVSLILTEEQAPSIDGGFEWMVSLIKQAFLPFTNSICAKEIVGSYCPGKFDLSIDGKKFAGISQRRIQGGVAVQIYLCVTGSGSKRAEIIAHFYKQAIKNAQTKTFFPTVEPSTMASLSELLNKNFTVESVWRLLLAALENNGIELFHHSQLTEQEKEVFFEYKKRIFLRNGKFLHKE